MRLAIQYLNEVWPVSKKVWPPLLSTRLHAKMLVKLSNKQVSISSTFFARFFRTNELTAEREKDSLKSFNSGSKSRMCCNVIQGTWKSRHHWWIDKLPGPREGGCNLGTLSHTSNPKVFSKKTVFSSFLRINAFFKLAGFYVNNHLIQWLFQSRVKTLTSISIR